MGFYGIDSLKPKSWTDEKNLKIVTKEYKYTENAASVEKNDKDSMDYALADPLGLKDLIYRQENCFSLI